MSNHGLFCWYELMAPDPDTAQAFYGAVAGWSAKDSGMPGMDYRLLGTDPERAVAGLMPVWDGAQPGWTAYVCVDDVDAAVAQAETSGATIYRAPMDIPDVGRMAIFGDPQGAKLAMLQPIANAPQPPSDLLLATGRFGWNELVTADWQAAWEFYAPLFRWQQGEPHDMGPMGVYQLFRPAGGDRDFGGMMSMAGRPPAWLYYINVEGLDAAIERVKTAGGAIVNGPNEVPGPMWVAQCTDPHGSAFALVSQAR